MNFLFSWLIFSTVTIGTRFLPMIISKDPQKANKLIRTIHSPRRPRHTAFPTSPRSTQQLSTETKQQRNGQKVSRELEQEKRWTEEGIEGTLEEVE
jgi:hypothetical protein